MAAELERSAAQVFPIRLRFDWPARHAPRFWRTSTACGGTTRFTLRLPKPSPRKTSSSWRSFRPPRYLRGEDPGVGEQARPPLASPPNVLIGRNEILQDLAAASEEAASGLDEAQDRRMVVDPMVDEAGARVRRRHDRRHAKAGLAAALFVDRRLVVVGEERGDRPRDRALARAPEGGHGEVGSVVSAGYAGGEQSAPDRGPIEAERVERQIEVLLAAGASAA